MIRPLLSLLLALPLCAQFRSVDLVFEGVGCAPCIESLPSRLQRIRGVESASVDAASGTLHVKLAPQNRVRLEQIRDAVEQDGTKASRATVSVQGQLTREDGRWMLRPIGGSSSYLIDINDSTEGGVRVEGSLGDLHPKTGPLVIHATSITKASP